MTASELDRVAVVGLGQMGRGIARRLDAAGLIHGAWDIDPNARSVAGLSESVHIAPVTELIKLADILIFAVPSTAEIEMLLMDVSCRPGSLVVDLTTSSPDRSRALSTQLATNNNTSYIDAAMTGGAAGADAGTLTLMIGGSEPDLERCRPFLEAFSERIFHLGSVGAGHTMKLVHNMILHTSFLATCEGLSLAEEADIDVKQAVDVLNAGNARSFVTETRFPRDILSGTMMARSRIANLEKDLGLANEFADSLGVCAPYGKMTHAVLSEALSAGHADTDFSWLYPLYKDLVVKLDDGR